MHNYRPILLAAVVSLIIGCAWRPSKPLSTTPAFLRGNPAQARQQLLTWIPVGTPQYDAERMVESLGLERTPQCDLGFIATDSISCRYTDERWFSHVIWIIQIDCVEGQVDNIICEQLSMTRWQALSGCPAAYRLAAIEQTNHFATFNPYRLQRNRQKTVDLRCVASPSFLNCNRCPAAMWAGDGDDFSVA